MGGVDILESMVYGVFGPENVDSERVADKNFGISSLAVIHPLHIITKELTAVISHNFGFPPSTRLLRVPPGGMEGL